jgi:hypothetical protein
MENAPHYGDARECLQAARVSMRQVKRLLSQPSVEAADESAALLRDIEVQLGCVEDLQSEVAVLASFFAGADKMLSGWLDAVRTRRGGYTMRGHAAPLTLVRKLSVEG